MEPAILHSLPGPDDIYREVLPNGIVVLARSNFNSPSVVISGYLSAGSLLEPDEKLGLASFTAMGMMRGTQQRSFQDIFESLESVGASLGYSGGTHSTGFSGRALVEDLDMLLNLLAETLVQPAFPRDPLERLRAQLLTGLAIRSQDTGEMASLSFDKVVYTNHPYSRPEDGYPETVQSILIEDMADFHRKFYGPRGMVIAIVGAVEASEAARRVSRVLGGWTNPDQIDPPPLPAVQPLQGLASTRVVIPGKSQADFLVGAVGPQRRSPDYLAASLGNNILGQFGMYGRIGAAVREKAGLAYYAYSSLSGGTGPGPWYISAGVDPADVERAVELVLAETARFVGAPVSKEELEDSQANYIGRLPLSLESNGGIAGALLTLERFDLGLDYYRRYPQLIQAVTVEEVLETARRYLQIDRMAVSVAGP